MTVKQGDLVRFADEVGGGRVIRIISDEIAEIETSDGWVLPAYKKTLVVIPEDNASAASVDSSKNKKPVLPKPVDLMQSKASAERHAVSRQVAGKVPVREVDLHINKLMDRVVGLTNTEILTIQLAAFRKEMAQSIRNNEREIIFIHGIGNGTLKNELRRVAGQEYKWCSQEDASFKEYGFGATRLRIPQNKPLIY